jgi:hypothetical protein
MVVIPVIGWGCPTSRGCFQVLSVDRPTHSHSSVDGGFTGNRFHPEADKVGRYLIKGFCLCGRDLNGGAVEIRVKPDPVFERVVLDYIVSVDLYGVM